MPRVYLTHAQPESLVASIAKRCALEFGEPVVLVDTLHAPASNLLSDHIESRLSGIMRCDFILPIGSPVIIGVASALAADHLDGHLQFLVWDRITARYLVHTIDLNRK